MSEPIHQDIPVAADAHRVYAALTNGATFAAFTGGAPAEISNEEGGAFSLFGGQITGRNIELVPDERVVQAWRVKAWPAGVYSIVRLELKSDGAGARVVLDQDGFPAEHRSHLEPGWHKMYWEPLKAFLR